MKRIVTLVAMMLVLSPLTVNAQSTPIAEQPNVVSMRLFPRAVDLGDGWTRQQSDILDIDRTVFRAARYMSFVGPEGSAVFVMIARPQQGADAEAWAAAGDARDRAQAAFAPSDDWTPATSDLQFPGIARSERAMSINQWVLLPAGVGLYAMDAGYVVLIGVIGSLATAPYESVESVSATDFLASFIVSQIETQT